MQEDKKTQENDYLSVAFLLIYCRGRFSRVWEIKEENIIRKAVSEFENPDDGEKIVSYLIEKLDSLEDFVNFDPADFLKRLTKVEAMLFTSKEMLTSEEACYYLGISMSQLYKMTSAHTIPHYKPRGKQVYFCKKELDEWMKNDPVVTIQDALKQSSLYFQLKKEQRNG